MAAVWPAGPDPIITSFECILLESTFGVPAKFTADKPAFGDTRLLCDVAAATGTENKDKTREEVARLKAEANSLAMYAGSARKLCCGV